jgi:hypothetical protein
MELHLSKLIEALKSELRKDNNSDPMFRLSSATLTAKVLVKEAASGTTGIEFLVLRAGVEGTKEWEYAHEVTIELTPLPDVELNLGAEE